MLGFLAVLQYDPTKTSLIAAVSSALLHAHRSNCAVPGERGSITIQHLMRFQSERFIATCSHECRHMQLHVSKPVADTMHPANTTGAGAHNCLACSQEIGDAQLPTPGLRIPAAALPQPARSCSFVTVFEDVQSSNVQHLVNQQCLDATQASHVCVLLQLQCALIERP